MIAKKSQNISTLKLGFLRFLLEFLTILIGSNNTQYVVDVYPQFWKLHILYPLSIQETKDYSPLDCRELAKREDGTCNVLNNRIECDFDGGDCCKKPLVCDYQVNLCRCSDPRSPNYEPFDYPAEHF